MYTTCGPDGHRYTGKTFWHEHRTAPIDRADPAAQRAEIVARRQRGDTWPAIAAALGMSPSNARRLYAETEEYRPRVTPADAGLVANLRAFIAATGSTSRRTFEAWPRRLASATAVEHRLGSWSQAIALARAGEGARAIGA